METDHNLNYVKEQENRHYDTNGRNDDFFVRYNFLKHFYTEV